MASNPDAQTVADAIAYGLAGYMQSCFARKTHSVQNELRLQLEAFEILSTLYKDRRIAIGVQPVNWTTIAPQAMDLGVRVKRAWPLVGEVKYFTSVAEVGAGREDFLQDLARLASAKVAARGLRLLVGCFHSHGKDRLWPLAGQNGGKVQRAIALALPNQQGAVNTARCSDIDAVITTWQDRTPKHQQLHPNDQVRTTLLRASPFQQQEQQGLVRVWNVESIIHNPSNG